MNYPVHLDGDRTRRRVCSACFGDDDLGYLVRSSGDFSRCDFCGTRRALTMPVGDVGDHVRERAEQFYGKAGDQLPYETREGGWQGANFDSYDLLMDEIGIDLPRDDRHQSLFMALVDALGEDQWCAFDWTRLELDESLQYSWSTFAETVKHRRRFFFHEANGRGPDFDDDRSPIGLLRELASLLDRMGRVVERPAGYRLYRARPRVGNERHATPASLGPPPAALALQSNRMNPPGIPMFYGAESTRLALAEVRQRRVSLGRFETLRPLRLVDLVDLPPVPGFFSDASRTRRQYLAFLHSFAAEVAKPIPRDERVNVDYLPTQVFTEFLRDAPFRLGPVDGIRYPSATGERGANVVLFATRDDVEGVPDSVERWGEPPQRLLRLSKVVQRRGSD